MKHLISHNNFTETRTFPENSRKSLSSVVIAFVLVFVLGRPMKIKKMASSDVPVPVQLEMDQAAWYEIEIKL